MISWPRCILFFIVPTLLFINFFVAETILNSTSKTFYYSEHGPVEGFQEITMFFCLLLSLFILRKMKNSEELLLKAWIGLIALGCFYIAFEEISWGQKFFLLNTPEILVQYNSQGETNIHNISQLFNRVPRAILEIGILIAGLIIPALTAWFPSKLPEKFSPIYAPPHIAYAAFITLIVKVLEWFPSWFDIKFFLRKSEVIETFFYYFIFLYLICLLQKWYLEGRMKPFSLAPKFLLAI